MPRAFVVFEDSPSVFTRVFKQHFRHVSIILPLGNGNYVHVNPALRKIDFNLLHEEDIQDMYDKSLYYDIRIVQADVAENFDSVHLPQIFTCVELVKRSLGIYKWWIHTPNQLYKHLVKGDTNV